MREDWRARRFTLEYQPQVNLLSRKVTRFEALLRWNRAEGVMSPKSFIPLAEEIGLIGEMGQWVLQQACVEAISWPPAIGVAVNISPVSLRDPDLLASIEQSLSKPGFPASRLELEITESSEITMAPECLTLLHAIHALGLRVVIDDLDAGHACLRYLLDFPFDKIKLDGIYAQAVCRPDRRGKAAREILKAISALCRTLGIDTLVEGVETPEQLAFVMEAGFTEVQGYIFGEAVAGEKIPEMLRSVDDVWRQLAIVEPGHS
jgi:EAL domain-containing protein (putative c-di-GMP-specific phosphodiesterase class I)